MRTLAFDTETALIAPGRLAPPMACLSWADSSGQKGVDDPDVGLRRIRDALRDSDTRIVGHNVSFDMGVVAQADPSMLPLIFSAYDAGRIACTQVQEKLKYVAGFERSPSTRLSDLADRYLGKSLGGKGGPDAWRFHYRKLIGVPVERWPKRARDYALSDAEVTLKCWERQDDMPDLFPQCRAAWALHLMGAWGFLVDPKAAWALDAKIRPPVEAMIEEMKRHGLYRADGTQDRAVLIDWITRAYGGNPPRGDITAKMAAKGATEGNVQYGEAVLRKSGDPVLMAMAQVAADQKELAAFLPMLLEGARTGLPVCPYWNVLVATGRTSCRAPNAQQFPKRSGVRECIVPRPGHFFFGADYTEAELRSLAQVLTNLFGPNSMAKNINSGVSLHLLTASRILEIPYEEAVQRYEAGDELLDNTRSLSKACNFGYPGGLGADSFVDYAAGYGQKITPQRGKELKRIWLDTIPEMKWYFNHISRTTSRGPALIEQHYSGRLRGNVGYTDGCNTFFQGLTADGAKRALYEVVRRQMTDRSSDLYGTRAVAFIHDEILAEGPEEQAAAAADEMAQVMVEQMSVVAPDVRHEADPYMTRRWYKKAKTVRDASGKLLLWEPSQKKSA